MNKRLLPQSISAEQAVLGSIIKDSKCFGDISEYFLEEKFFSIPKHQLIFRAILALYEDNVPIDLTNIAEELTMEKNLAKIGGRSYLVELIEGVASVVNVKSYADIVLEKYNLRQLISICTNIQSECYGQMKPTNELLDDLESKVFKLSEIRIRDGFKSLADYIPFVFDNLDRISKVGGEIIGLPTGFIDLDAKTGGLQNGDFIIVAGRPSMGKTAFVLNMAEHIALNRGKTIGIFSIEMPMKQLAMRFLCGNARVNQHNVRQGIISDDDWKQLTISSGPFANSNIYIDDSASLNTMELRAKSRRLKSQHNVDMIIIDYIQLMKASHRTESRQIEMSVISGNIKSLAKELDIPIVAVSQLSRKVEDRSKDAHPQLSDLRESGALEQDADVVMLLYRPEYYLKEKDKNTEKHFKIKGTAELNIAKQRNGPTGTVNLAWLDKYVCFENIMKVKGSNILPKKTEKEKEAMLF